MYKICTLLSSFGQKMYGQKYLISYRFVLLDLLLYAFLGIFKNDENIRK